MNGEAPLILHHFDASPFAEKIRLALGIKGLSWRGVEIPMVMPKPKLTALTGGYRKTPVLQIGADIYCDTLLIALELERRFPKPSLFPNGNRAYALTAAAWADERLFRPGAALSMGTNQDLPEPLLADRRAFFNFLDFTSLEDRVPHFYAQFRSQLALTNELLTQSLGAYLAGESPGWLDVLAYFPLWMARANVSAAGELLESFDALLAWEQRMATLGHGNPTSMPAEEALEFARSSSSESEPGIAPGAWPRGLSVGASVSVTPDDYGQDAVHGTLWQLSDDRIALRREDPLAGNVVVHFPRIGFELTNEA
ncbi:MAG: glutathione S-transferase family protein [Pseudomonadota bacterium]